MTTVEVRHCETCCCDGVIEPDSDAVICAGCGDPIPDGTPPYPADMNGTGRLCPACHGLIRPGPGNVLVACNACPGDPQFYVSEMGEHREIAHAGVGPGQEVDR